jgi:acetoin utilization protein AcuB
MTVKDLMRKSVVTVAPDDTSDKVFSLLTLKNIRHLPVLENGKLVGIVSDRDLKRVMGARQGWRLALKAGQLVLTVSTRKVSTFMRRAPVTIAPEADATEAASIMVKKKIGALPVVKQDKLVGIVTETDLLRAYVRMAKRVGGRSR